MAKENTGISMDEMRLNLPLFVKEELLERMHGTEKHKKMLLRSLYAMSRNLEQRSVGISKKDAKAIVKEIYAIGNEFKKFGKKVDRICNTFDRMHYSMQDLKKKRRKYGYRI